MRMNNLCGVVRNRLLLGFLCAVIAISCSLTAGISENQTIESEHHYKLYPRADGLAFYVCLCTDAGCDICFDVYPQGYVVRLNIAEGECSHIYRKVEKCKRLSIEGSDMHYHEIAQWYECVCEHCGETIEAYETDGNKYQHEVSIWEDIHIMEKHQHLYVGHCDVCDALQYDIVDCMQYEDGSCMGGYKFVAPLLN